MVVKETDLQILGRLLALDGKRVSPENARLVLAMKFPAKDRAKIEELGEKANEGTLTADEKKLYSAYVRVIDLLAVLQSRARLALTKLGKAG
jgi:hypothetical protein